MHIRVYLADGSLESFAQPDEARAKALWDPQPAVHSLGVGLVLPMAEQVGGIGERSP